MYNSSMATKTFPHVEDYIEIISGYRDPARSSPYGLFHSSTSPLSLARYDVNVVESFGQQAVNSTAFTDRQAKLAIDLILKYERQLAKIGVDITPIKDNPTFRLNLRTIDRSSRAWVDGETIYVRFPFNEKTIESVRATAKQSQGGIRWDHDAKVWKADLTEYNVSWMHAFALVNKFEIDVTLQTLMDKITEVETTPYAIELCAGKDKLSITNAEDTLTEYIEEHLGGFSTDNLLTLVDNSPILGYTAEKVIEEVVIEAYGHRFWSLCANRELKVDVNSNFHDNVVELIRYAETTNRWPIYLYEPDMSDRLAMLFIRHFTKDQVVNLDKQQVNANTRLAHCRVIPKDPVNRIPLLVSSAGMIFGGDRQIWLDSAEKVVYFTKDVYNKQNKKGKDICKLG